MFTASLKRGLKAGLIAGVAFGLFMALVANPLVAFADALGHESTHVAGGHHDADTGGTHHAGIVSMTVANGVSIVSGLLWGVFLGMIVFGIVYYFLEPAIPGTGRTKSYFLGVAGFVTVSGAPWLVLPPHPPGVDQPLPAETRLMLYGGMMIAGAVVCLLSGAVYNRLRETRGGIVAALIATLPFGLLAIPAVLSPANPATGTLHPALATGLTGMVVFGQGLLWTLLAGVHARLRPHETERRESEPTPAVDTAVTAD
ncbi:MAG: CbtA family protein [Halobacteriales archaeon]|nr:CbtA family protein [Halobacteriales archaeon]